MYYTNKGIFFDIFEYKEYNFCKVHNISFMFLVFKINSHTALRLCQVGTSPNGS